MVLDIRSAFRQEIRWFERSFTKKDIFRTRNYGGIKDGLYLNLNKTFITVSFLFDFLIYQWKKWKAAPKKKVVRKIQW